MSKENNNLRLLGSPVNLSCRGKKKEDKRNCRNRPRSALLSTCITPDNPERYKRPFSADAKEHAPSTRNFLNQFNSELLQSYNNSTTVLKIYPPTAELLGKSQSSEKHPLASRELCSNASDLGSEDTLISLGTKIKAKAQLGLKPKNNNNSKKFLRYKNIARKSRKPMESSSNEDFRSKDYGLEVKIIEKSPTPTGQKNMRSWSPNFNGRSYESYFLPLDEEKAPEIGCEILTAANIPSEIEEAIDTYTRRLKVTKQQLSLVEEECTHEMDSVPSQNMSSLSPENSLNDKFEKVDVKGSLSDERPYTASLNNGGYNKITQNYICEARTYASFYDDFHLNSADPYKSKLSSTHTDSSSKDSGYPDSAGNEEKYKHNYSLPNTSILKKLTSQDNIEQQPKSLESTISATSNDNGCHKTLSLNKSSWSSEPLNHSRLLYRDFFLKKEGHIAIPPQNSPVKTDLIISGTSEVSNDRPENDNIDDNIDYPLYLKHSTTKAYTSKVIEDYKKELEAINSLHELTIKDIKADAVSPTPFNIDKMFEDASNFDTNKSGDQLQNDSILELTANNKNSLDNKRDITKISTKELIQNYLKVKEGDYKNAPKASKILEKKLNNAGSFVSQQEWNNKNLKDEIKPNIPVNIRNQTKNYQKTPVTTSKRLPLSARIDSVQNDKDVDSWMSLSAHSPRELDIQENNVERSASTPNVVQEEKVLAEPDIETEPKITKDLNDKSTVLDIYSMLKEIESYGDNPVTTDPNTNLTEIENKKEERSCSPKDNFMEIFEFLEKVEQSANDALSIVSNTSPASIPKLEALLKLPQIELAQRLVTASLQLEERSCCIALLQESLANHKEQMVKKVSNLEKQSIRNIAKVKQECEETIKRHQNFIDQLINDKKTLNHRIEQLVDERRSLEERWKRSAQALEERYKLELRNQHDKMQAAQQVARQRWVRQKAEKIKELTVKGLEGELREMAERQQKEISDLKMMHAEQTGRAHAKHAQELEELRRTLEEEKEAALVKERNLASSRLEKQILEIELTYQEQRTRLVAELRAENERVASELAAKEKQQRDEFEKWRQEQEKLLEEKRVEMQLEIEKEKENLELKMKDREKEIQRQLEDYKRKLEMESQAQIKQKTLEIAAQHKLERDKEIEKAIESMEAEAQAGRKELQDALRRNKEQYEAELKELAETEQATLRRYQEAQARVRQTEDKCAELEVTITQLETRNRVLTEKNTQLETRAEEIRAGCEETWRNKMDALNKQIEDMRKTHEEQMHQLYAKVKVAVARKDSAIQALTREAGKYQEKITLLEQKLQQQRKDFLAKQK